MMCKWFARLAILGSALITACWSQILPQSLDYTRSNAEGLHIYGISAFWGYSTFSFPQAAGTAPVTTNDHMMSGVMGALGWQRLHGRTNFSVRYSAGYNRDFRQNSLSNLNQIVAASLTRTLGAKWQLDLTATGQDASFEQFVFQSSNLSSLSQTPATFDNLSASMSVGQFTDPQSAVLLNSPTSTTPITALLLGSRVLSYSTQASLTYQHSSRLSVSFASFAMGGENRSGSQGTNYVLPHTLGGDAGITLSYALSSRTEVNVSLLQNYMRSAYQRASGTSATAGLSRKMGRNWFMRAFAGGYLTETFAQAAGTPQNKQMIAGGSLGVRTYGNTLLASFTRTGYDLSGGGLGATELMSVAWNWRYPRRNWGCYTSFSRSATSSPGFSNISGWQASGGFSDRLRGNLLLNIAYTHVSGRSVFLSLANDVTVNSIRISLAWVPRLRGFNAGGPDEPEQQ
jgi:hypothetical protein